MGVSRRDVLRSGAVLVAGIACESSLSGHGANEQTWIFENDLIRRWGASEPEAD